ncbi:MAG: hypothetical protein LBF24_01330 [Puniceicoccales bacterium]|nr:hypothetical protein [Puniceicoccales bacterium]
MLRFCAFCGLLVVDCPKRPCACCGEIFRDDPAALLRPDRETADLLLRRYGINISTRITREKICRFFGRRAPV